jgi:hypothetical protein
VRVGRLLGIFAVLVVMVSAGALGAQPAGAAAIPAQAAAASRVRDLDAPMGPG